MTIHRSLFARPVVQIVGAAGLVLTLAALFAALERPEPKLSDGVDRDPSEVVATLRIGQTRYSETLKSVMAAARGDPDDPDAAKAAARVLIQDGRLAGDSRLVGASLGLLRPFLDSRDAEILILAATARQYQHDFPGALQLLDRAIAIAPRDVNAVLMRATIKIVLGRFAEARADCAEISALSRPDLGFLCQATSYTMTSEAPAVYQRLAAILAKPDLLDAGLRPYALGLMGEIADLQGRDDIAIGHFEDTLTLDSDDLRVRLMLADIFLSKEQSQSALTLLETAPDVDGVLIRRYLAATALGKVDIAEPARIEIGKRVQLNMDLGLNAHAREDAMYFLVVMPDPQRALERATANWALQHEFEDARILIAAAMVAGQPAAATAVVTWMNSAGVSVPALALPDEVMKAAE